MPRPKYWIHVFRWVIPVPGWIAKSYFWFGLHAPRCIFRNCLFGMTVHKPGRPTIDIPIGSLWRDIYGETTVNGFRYHTYEVVEIVGDHIRFRDTEESITPIDFLDRNFFLRMFNRVTDHRSSRRCFGRGVATSSPRSAPPARAHAEP
jgi:hypothetical protein